MRRNPRSDHNGRRCSNDLRKLEGERIMIILLGIVIVLLLCASWLKAASDDDDHAGRG